MLDTQSTLSTAEGFLQELYASLTMDARQFEHAKIPVTDLKTHGTTIGVLRVDDGRRLVAFSDGKMSVMNQAFGTNMDKVMQVGDRTCLLISGSAMMGVRLSRSFRSYIAMRENIDHRPLAASAKVNYIVGALAHIFPMAAQGMGVMPLMATFEEGPAREGRIYLFMMDGSYLPVDDCKVIGSGFTSGNSALEVLYEDEMEREGHVSLARGISFAQRVLKKTAKDDNGSGGSWTIKVIDQDGVQSVQEQTHAER